MTEQNLDSGDLEAALENAGYDREHQIAVSHAYRCHTDLLAALEALVGDCEGCTFPDGSNHDLAQARAAIAKAKEG